MFYRKKTKKNEKNSQFYRLCRRLRTPPSFLLAEASAQKSSRGVEFNLFSYSSDFNAVDLSRRLSRSFQFLAFSRPTRFNVCSRFADFNASSRRLPTRRA